MSNNQSKKVRIEGTVAPEFEQVRQLFERQMNVLAEKNAQLCVYVGEEKVIDLWASVENDASFSADSLVNVFSSGKSFEAIAIASLVTKGLIDYNAKITDYWPEFGANGKAALTVAELMRHEAGLAAFSTSIAPEDLLPENIKQNRVGVVIENHVQKFRQGKNTQREYHAITRGWIINELFRRVDPAQRTIGEYLLEDIASQLGADVSIGVKEVDLSRISDLSPLSFGYYLRESLKPEFLGRKVKENIFQIVAKLFPLISGARKGTTAGLPPAFIGMKNMAFFNEASIRMGETPSANAHCSARGLAKVAAVMATGGKWAGTRYLSETAWDAMHDVPIDRNMLGLNSTFTQGGVARFSEGNVYASRLDKAANNGRNGFYGWMGFGGSILQWHPEHQIGFGFVPTSLHILDVVNERGKLYQNAVLNCLKA